ncbi:hypothetical protein F4Z99_07400 [Candidatus Poribacteria bacterium]|nr:hypothetical protein [Candidatus Poribacteria bacterium]
MKIKEKMCKSLWFQLLLASVVGILFYNASVPAEDAEEWMPDPNLRRIVSETLDVESLTIADMQRLHDLVSDSDGIESLEGLQHAVNLKFLQINESQISDLTPLTGLVKLNTLKLDHNLISDIAPLTELVNLEWLQLDDCQISDLTPLAKLVKLNTLILAHNPISDITPLAGLANLEGLLLNDCQILDIMPLAELVNLRWLHLEYNQISDVTPIRSLTKLERLTIIGNPIDYTQLGNLPAELRQCRVDASGYKAPIAERIQNRDYPATWVKEHTLSVSGQHTIEIFTRFDLVFGSYPFYSLRDPITRREPTTRWLTRWGLPPVLKNSSPSPRVGHIDEVREVHTEVLRLNPNMILLVGLDFESGHPDDYGEDWEGWLRDKEGNRVTLVWGRHATEELIDHRIDFTKPVVIEKIVQQAKSISECGLYDGIFLDHWTNSTKLQGIYTKEEEFTARDIILRRIREVVPNDFLILVNAGREKIRRWAPYVNGIYMETGRDLYDLHPGEPEGHTLAGIRDIEDALLWNETNLRKPTLNLLESELSPFKPIDGPEAKQRNRFFTAMALTHSNASFFMFHYDAFYWYDFWDAPLGQPIGGDETKAQLYENREGLFIREFTNGWAVYNRSGKEQEIELPQEVSGWNSGVENQRRHTLVDLDGEIYLKAEMPPTADVNGDGVVNIQDLVIVANAFAEAAPDLNGDGVVNIQDLVIVANAF